MAEGNDGSTRSFARAGVVTTLVGAAYLGWLAGDLGGARTDMLVSDLVFVVTPVVAAGSCWRAHRRDRDRHAAWLWLMVGCLTWAFGSVTYAAYQLLVGQVAPIPSPADVGYIGYAVAVAVGVLRLPRTPGNRWSRWRSGLDGVVIAGCLLLTSAIWVLEPILDATTMTTARMVALGYPVADLVAVAVVLARCVVVPGTRRLVWVPLSTGLVVLAVTDSLYVASSFRHEFRPGGVLDLGWYAAFALVALAATAPAAGVPAAAVPGVAAAGAPQAPGFLRRAFPSVSVALAVVACALEPSTVTRHWYWGLALLVGGCVVVRQVLVVADQTALARDLSRAVERRTVELRHREQWWQDIVSNLTDVVLVLDRDGAVVYCSPAVNTALGHMPMLESAEQLLSQVHPEDHPQVLSSIVPVVVDGTRSRGFVECRLRRSDDSYGWFEVQAVGQLAERALEGAVLTLHDVSERRELTDRLQQQAHHDTLTGLPNRALLMERIEAALVAGPSRSFGLLLLDLDDFKVINDRHGHAAGDVVLTVIGQRLTGLVRASDTVARLGGDEFAVLVDGATPDVRAVAERLTEAVERPVVAGGRRFHVRTSIGAVIAADLPSESAQSLLSHADIALYEAKARDKGGVVLIEGTSRDDAAKQVLLKEQIAQPDLDQFSVVYQPIVDLVSGEMRGVEALLRWHHPDLGPVPPDVFIPLAEHGGSIQTLGWFVLDRACAQLAAWQREFPQHRLAIGVNVSVRQLDEAGFAQRVAALVAGHGIGADQVVVELTEQSLALDFETAVEVVAELRAIGVSVAVDDYGTGYSSLQYLHRFDADVVKIDRSFVANVVGSVHTQKIVRSVMHMAESLDLQSIAEGIETPEQLTIVQSLGCELGQGYLFSRPVPPDAIGRLLLDPAPFTVPGVEAVLTARA